MATVDDNEWQKLPPDQKVQHKVHEKSSISTFYIIVVGMESSSDWL